jgi:hypothetical protein
MDIDVTQINYFFFPFDLSHLLLLWAVLAVFLLLFAALLSAANIYPTARQFWQWHGLVLAGVYLVSAVCFLLLRLNVVGVMIVLLTLAFVILGRVGAREDLGPLEDWWLFRFLEREREQ